LARFLRRKQARDSADFRIADRSAQAVAAKDKGVAGSNRVWTLDVDLNERVRPERPDDHVALESLNFFRRNVLPPGHFPNVAVIKGELLDFTVADTVTAAIAHVGEPRAIRANNQCGCGRSEALEFEVLLTNRVDAGVGLDERPAQAVGHAVAGVLLVGERDVADGL